MTVRSSFFALAGLLALLAVLTIFAQAFSLQRQDVISSFDHPKPASVVQKLAAFVLPYRGDIKAARALSIAATALDPENKAQRADLSAQAKSSLTGALSLSPHDAWCWLALALIRIQDDALDPLAGDALRNAYYMAPNDLVLVPSRLIAAAGSKNMKDPEFRELVRSDIRLILTREASLKPVIATAYQDSPDGRAFIKEVTDELDPAFGATLATRK